LLDFGSHLVDQALVLLGPVGTVYAEWRLHENGLDDDMFVALHHVGGARSHLWGSRLQAAPGPRFRVSGTEGAYVVDALMDGQEAALLAGRSPATEGSRWGQEPPARWGRIHRRDRMEVVETLPGAWPDFYAQFAAAVRGRGDVPVSPYEAVATARVLDAARNSASNGETVILDHEDRRESPPGVG
jgi:predicted dehydrogenase